MNKSDLRTGMHVTLRNDNTYYVMLCTGLSGEQENVLVHKVGYDTGWMPLSQYDKDMRFHDIPDGPLPQASEEDDRQWDIMKVDACRQAADLFMKQDRYRTIWKREE